MILTLIGGGIFLAFFGIICFPIVKRFYENTSIISSLIGIIFSVALFTIPSKLLEMIIVIINNSRYILLTDDIQNIQLMIHSSASTIFKIISFIMFIFYLIVLLAKTISATSLKLRPKEQPPTDPEE